MKNILIFSTAYLPFIGGAEIAVAEITNRLAGSQDYTIDLITARLDKSLKKREKIRNVNVYRIGYGGFFDKFFLPLHGVVLALRLNSKNEYQLVWSIMASQAGIAAAFFKILKPKIKLLLNLQEGDEEAHLRRYVFNSRILYDLLIKPISRLVIKKADHITVISQYLKARAIRGGARCEIEVVPNGVDIEKFKMQNSKCKINELKEELGFKENDQVIITVSRLVKKNGINDLIRAMTFLGDVNCRLLIVGTGPDEAKLKGLAKDLKLDNKILFLGKIKHDDIPKFLWMSDIFARPSLSEGLGNVFLEAMAAGLPIIGTPVGGIPDFLIDDATGLFCRPGQPEDIAEKVRRLINDRLLAARLAENGLALVRREYGWEKIAENYNMIFNKIILTGKCRL